MKKPLIRGGRNGHRIFDGFAYLAGSGKSDLDSLDLETVQYIPFVHIDGKTIEVHVENFSALGTNGVMVGMGKSIEPLAARPGLDRQQGPHVRHDLKRFIDRGQRQGRMRSFEFLIYILGRRVASRFQQGLHDSQTLTSRTQMALA